MLHNSTMTILGRVLSGVCRGTVGGECWLVADPATAEGEERLRIFTRTTDGFALAEEDARLRGTGELVGTKQSGASELRLADVTAEPELLQSARRDAIEIVSADATLAQPEHARLREAVWRRYGQTLELSAIG